ncbi:hypothetical protein Agub_g8838 [Astrephomene gubernaculifera]|uniref:GPI mannosyltransferase 2 n=1 Tax=Astrephomene gubernaculifera TaxID=47775 RepID=A0AAD3DU74_9CHLO|nr:hypothetical protein Agub_g8838 [Astrephomene gubernaculifera]
MGKKLGMPTVAGVLGPDERRLVLLAALVRSIVLLATTAADLLFVDYDTSKHITPVTLSSLRNTTSAVYGDLEASPAGPRTASGPQQGILQGWIVWDSVFFADIASRGYVYEQYYAFFPLLPGLVSWAPRGLFAPLLLALNAVASITTTVLLYRLGSRLTRDSRLAALACLFFIFNPATIFQAAPYTEAAFAAATLTALYWLYCRDRLLPAIAAVAASCGLRSNGVINAGYLGHGCLCRAVRAWPTSKLRAVLLALQGVAAAVIAVLPLVKFQYDGYTVFCRTESHRTAEMMMTTTDLSNEHGKSSLDSASPASPLGDASSYAWPRSWCSSRLPYIYGFVQAQYWNVGFLRYWTLQQLPNFLLAAPVLLLSIAGLAEYCRANAVLVANLGLLQPATTTATTPIPRKPQEEEGLAADASQGQARNGSSGSASGKASGGRNKEEKPLETLDELLPGGYRVGGGCMATGTAGEDSRGGRQLRKRPMTAQSSSQQAAAQAGEACEPPRGGTMREGLVLPATAATSVAGSGGSLDGKNSNGSSSSSSGRGGYLSPDLAVFMYPWAFCTAVAISTMHVQVATRFLLSSCPQLYWYMAHLWLRCEEERRRGSRGAAAGGGVASSGGAAAGGGSGMVLARCGGCLSGGGLRHGWLSWCDVALWRWCLLYLGLGCLLFINFLPWT